MSYFNPYDKSSWDAPEEEPSITEQRMRAEALRSQPRPQQAGGGGGINPMQAYNVYSKFAAGTPVASGTTASGSAPIAGGAGQASATGPVVGAGQAGGAGGSFGSTAMAAAPWAALAAGIVMNESKQRGDGNRGNSTGEHIGDIASGKVLERDFDRYLAHNSAGDVGRRVGMMGTPSGIVRNGKDLGKWFKGLF